MVSFADWPAGDRARWEAAFKAGDLFDDSGRGAHLAPTSRQAFCKSYGRFLTFISAIYPDRLSACPQARIDPSLAAEYVAWRGRSCGERAIAIDLDHLRCALKLLCPDTDWSWLLKIVRHIAATAPRKVGKYHLITSDRLYLLGIDLMDHAVADAHLAGCTSQSHALQYRDGLIIALLALIPLRSRTLTALRIGEQLAKAGDLWALDIPSSDTKSARAIDYPISSEMSARIDVHMDRFRGRIPGADKHTSPWASNKGRPMSADAIYRAVGRRTKEAFGFEVNLHRFRHAAASLWSTHDPANVRGAKDLLGHASFVTTEKYYVMGQSRIAGRALAHAINSVRK
jgi:hypothetical protein